MEREKLRVLAVSDPAVMGYVGEREDLLGRFGYPVQMDVVPWERYYPTMLDVFAGKAEYDVVMAAGHLWKRDFIEKGYISAIELDAEDILPVIEAEMKWQNRYYLSPSFCDGHIIVYRKSILKAVLGELPRAVITPQEYMRIAKKLNLAGYKITMKAHPSEIFTDALPFLRMYGGDVYDCETGAVTCGCDEVVKGLEQYCALKNYALNHIDTFGNQEVAECLQKRIAAMGVTWSGQMGVIFGDNCREREDLGFATFSTAWNVTWSFAVSAAGKKQSIAERFLKFMRSPEVDRIAGKSSGAPVREASYRLGREQFPWYQTQLEMFQNAVLLPDLQNAGEKNGVFYQEISAAFAGRKTPAAAMREAGKKIAEF